MSKYLICVIGVFFLHISVANAEDRYVTSLADDGVGSFRSVVKKDGPANIIFKTKGNIILTKPLEVAGDNLKINIEKENPITLVGFGLVVTGSNFEISNLRIWVGDLYNDPSVSPDQDGVLILGKESKPVKHGKVSNCTIFAAVDEGISTYGEVSDVLFFRNMILWGLNRSHHQDVVSDKNPDIEKIHHSMSILVSNGAERIRFAQNLIALNRHRNPRVMPGASVAFVNNFVYGWGTSVDDGLYVAKKKGIEKELKIAFLNNYYQGIKKSYLLPKSAAGKTKDFKKLYGSFYRLENSSQYAIYDKGNEILDYKGNSRPFNPDPIVFNTDEGRKIAQNYFSDLIQEEQVKKLMPTSEVPQMVLKTAGAFPSSRMGVESKIIELIQKAEGDFIDSPKELEIGYPAHIN